MDVSDYEDADIIFDLNNTELPEELHQRFDYIIDGGTLEHIFNFSQALANVAKMLKVDGKVFHYLPAHNYINHGFYTVSPSVLQAFYTNNGFQVIHMNLVLTAREFWQDPNKYVVDKLDKSFMTNPDYRFCNLNSSYFTLLPGYIGILRCIAQRKVLVEKIGAPLQTHWYKAQDEREKLLREMLEIELDWKSSELRIGIFGIGGIARKFLKIARGIDGFAKDKIKGFFDNDTDRHGNIFEGYGVFSPSEICHLGVNSLVIAAGKSDAEIFAQVQHLQKEGIQILRMREYLYML